MLLTNKFRKLKILRKGKLNAEHGARSLKKVFVKGICNARLSKESSVSS